MSVTGEDAKIPPTGEADTDPPIDRQRLVRSLNEKGTALFESTCDLHVEMIDKVSKNIC